MDILTTIAYWLMLCIAALCTAAELKRDLMMMQQNSYRIDRYMRWLNASGDTTSLPRLVGMVAFLGSMVTFARPFLGMILIAAFSLGQFLWLSTRHYKKPLVWTRRCARIYVVSALICVIVAVAALLAVSHEGEQMRFFAPTVALCGLFCASHIVMVVAVWLLKPVEKHINKGFYDDAARILRSMPDLKVIGITGSYGKTSTKHYLYRILSESFDVLMTPGSYNTTMGVIRTVREMMKPYTQIFICEMGAKQLGDIKEICELVHPQIGIITAVGPQHLESFKTIDNVCRTKFELIDSLPANGFAVVNDDFEPSAKRKVDNVECYRYAVNNTGAASYIATDIRYSANGTTFTIECPDGKKLALRTQLVGECNISNLLAAVIVAMKLGVPDDKIRYAVERIEQVEHRLNVRRTPGGVTIIDDAFNSNPTGSAMALDVLAAMDTGKRIIVTPGMIELGDRQDELNREFGRKIAQSADVAIVVGLYNREAITSGIEDGGCEPPETYTVDTLGDAQQVLAKIAAPGDTILYENDLPDTFK